MKILGDEMLNSGNVLSSEFADNTIRFNRLIINSLSEISLQNVSKDILITEKDTNKLFSNIDFETDEWSDLEKHPIDRNDIILTNDTTSFNYIHFIGDSERFLELDNSLFNNLDTTSKFVIDWWLFQYAGDNYGCLLFNGDPLVADPILNKELCITTSGSIVDPITKTIVPHTNNDGYLNILYPPLKSTYKINNDLWHHCALVAKDGIIQLIIDAKVHSQTQFTDITSMNNVLLGSGYGNPINCYIAKFRVTENTDLGWFDGGFDLPDEPYDITPDTSLLIDSDELIDSALNYEVIVNGDPLNIYQTNHYCYLKPSYSGYRIKFDFPSMTNVYLPFGKLSDYFILKNLNADIKLIPFYAQRIKNDQTYGIVSKFNTDIDSVELRYSGATNPGWVSVSDRDGSNGTILGKTFFDQLITRGINFSFHEGKFKNYGYHPEIVSLNENHPGLKFSYDARSSETPRVWDSRKGPFAFMNALFGYSNVGNSFISNTDHSFTIKFLEFPITGSLIRSSTNNSYGYREYIQVEVVNSTVRFVYNYPISGGMRGVATPYYSNFDISKWYRFSVSGYCRDYNNSRSVLFQIYDVKNNNTLLYSNTDSVTTGSLDKKYLYMNEFLNLNFLLFELSLGYNPT